MTKKQKENEICKYIEKYKKILFLQDWDFVVYIEDKKSERGSAAEINVDYVYQSARIWFYPGSFDHKNKYLEEYVLHELCHCLTEPLFKVGVDLLDFKVRTYDGLNEKRENLTEKIAKIIRGLNDKQK